MDTLSSRNFCHQFKELVDFIIGQSGSRLIHNKDFQIFHIFALAISSICLCPADKLPTL